jgi:hypothetical protein
MNLFMTAIDRLRLLDPRGVKGPTLAHLKMVEDENALLRQHAAKQITDATLMTGLHVHDGGMEIGLTGGAAGVLAEQLAKQYLDSGAANFVELSFRSAEMAPGEQFTVTIQRVGGETPGAAIKRLKAALIAALPHPTHQG